MLIFLVFIICIDLTVQPQPIFAKDVRRIRRQFRGPSTISKGRATSSADRKMKSGTKVLLDSVLEAISDGLTEDERVAFYRSLNIISGSLDSVAKTYDK